MSPNNKIVAMLDLDKVRALIDNCPTDEIVILCSHWSINGPKYAEGEENNEMAQFDFEEFESWANCTIMVSDYDDLIADPHTLMIF